MTETPADDSEQAFLDRAVVIALGSNLPGGYASSRDLLNAAFKALDERGLRVARASSWWRSEAWPDATAPAYVNGVVFAEPDLDPRSLLEALHDLERDFKRLRGKPNDPRTLDLDLIAYGRRIDMEGPPIIPHPRFSERRFVVGPIAEIAPTWTHPLDNTSATELLKVCRVGCDAEPIHSRADRRWSAFS